MKYCKCDDREGDNLECKIHPPLYPLPKLESSLLELLRAADALAASAEAYAKTEAECGRTNLGYSTELKEYFLVRGVRSQRCQK